MDLPRACQGGRAPRPPAVMRMATSSLPGNNISAQPRSPFSGSVDTIVRLNVGGMIYCTTASTLSSQGSTNLLASLVNGRHENVLRDDSGAIFIDRDGELFRYILDYLRTGKWRIPANVNKRDVFDEARYYCVEVERLSHVSDESLHLLRLEQKDLLHKTMLADHEQEINTILQVTLKSFKRCIENKKSTVCSPFIMRSEEAILKSINLWREDQWLDLPALPHTNAYFYTSFKATLNALMDTVIYLLKTQYDVTVKGEIWWFGFEKKRPTNIIVWVVRKDQPFREVKTCEYVSTDTGEKFASSKELPWRGERNGFKLVWQDPF